MHKRGGAGSAARKAIRRSRLAGAVTVVAKISLREHRGKVRTDGGVFDVEHAGEGWFAVSGPAAEGAGRVRYEPNQGILEIERPGIRLVVDFQPEMQGTRFTFGGHTYQAGSMDFGTIWIKDGERNVVQGHVTLSGVRLTLVAPEMQPIERELAFGLALRGEALDEDFWREDEPFFEWIKETAADKVLGEDARLHHEG